MEARVLEVSPREKEISHFCFVSDKFLSHFLNFFNRKTLSELSLNILFIKLKIIRYVVDLVRFRRVAAGDRLRGQYQALSQDPNSLSNLDQVGSN